MINMHINLKSLLFMWFKDKRHKWNKIPQNKFWNCSILPRSEKG